MGKNLILGLRYHIYHQTSEVQGCNVTTDVNHIWPGLYDLYGKH